MVASIEPAFAGVALALGELAMLVLETTQQVNLWRWVNVSAPKLVYVGGDRVRDEIHKKSLQLGIFHD